MEVDDTDMEDHKEAVLEEIQSIVNNEYGLEEINGDTHQNNDNNIVQNNDNKALYYEITTIINSMNIQIL